MLMTTQAIDELARRLCALLPATAAPQLDALMTGFRHVLKSGLEQLDLASRADFEVLRLALLRTRERLEQLEYRLLALEESAVLC